MKRYRKILSIILVVLMVVAAFPTYAASFNAGMYTGVGQGNGGDVTVQVTFDANKITDIQVVNHNETPGISDNAIAQLPQAIIDAQSLKVDAISGATKTSNAIIDAVKDCVVQAGEKPDNLMTEIEVESIDPAQRAEEVEILIIGGGGTGLAAAVSAYQNGATNVMLVEKMGRFGGSTAVSGGIQGATSTRYKKAMGSTDADADWLEDWVEDQNHDLNVLGITCQYPNYDRVAYLMSEATNTVNWVESYLGQEYCESLIDYGNASKRVHILKESIVDGVQGGDCGYILTDRMVKFLKDNTNIDMRLNTKGISLITDENGNVKGAVVEDAYGSYEVKANRGVILATGGFPFDHELLSKYLPVFDECMDLSVANSGNTGDGIKMALAIGAAEYPDPFVIGFGAGVRNANLGTFADATGLGTKMMVDASGKRFCDEALAYSAITIALSRANTPTWAISDSQDAAIALVDAAVDGIEIVKADTIEELATAMGLDPTTVKQTVDEYNALCESGVDTQFGKTATIYGENTGNALRVINQAPYYAVQVHPSNAGTIGGVVTNWDCQVLREDGSIIGGLYAGGECSNREYYAYTYMSGSGVSTALTTGRLMGINIMK